MENVVAGLDLNSNKSQGIDVKGALSDYLQVNQAFRQVRMQGEQDKNAMAVKNIYATGDASTQDGQADILKRLYQVDPQAASVAQGNFDKSNKERQQTELYGSQVKEHLATTDEKTLKNYGEKQNLIGSAMSRIIDLDNDPKVPKEQVQLQYQQEVMKLLQAGVIDKQHLGGLDPQFNRQAIDKLSQTSKINQDAIKSETEARLRKAQTDNAAARTEAEGKQEVNIMVGDRPHIGVLDKRTNKVTDTGSLAVVKGETPTAATGDTELDARIRVAKAELMRLYGPTYTRMSKIAQSELNQNLAQMLKEDPNVDPKELAKVITESQGQTKAGQATTRSFATGVEGRTVRSLNVAIDHLSTLDELAKGLSNKDVKAVNRFYNILSKEFGYEEVTSFEAAKQIVADEVLKAVVGTGAGALHDREILQAQFDKASSPEQLADVIRVSKKLMGGQLVGLRKQYTSGGGAGGDAEFNKKLLPGTTKELEGLRNQDSPNKGKEQAPAAVQQTKKEDPLGIR